jgi:hypothetical protein
MKSDLPIGMMDQPPEVIRKFRQLVANGESPRLAEMFAMRQGPRLETATTNAIDLKPSRNNEGVGFQRMQKIRADAKKAGIPVTDDSFYNGSIADERGAADPDAWVHPGEGRDKLRRVVRERGGVSEELGVGPGECQERMDVRKKQVEKQLVINQKKLQLRKQLKRDGMKV